MAGLSSLTSINNRLAEGYEARVIPPGRLIYINHHTQTTSWIPPADGWESGNGLPYGWESALDQDSKPYFINHAEKCTTRDDPREDPEYVEPPKPREVQLQRDPQLGFGFVAGSEKPVIVRFVTEGGPSEDKLLPGDQIVQINGEDVKKSPREYVIELVRACKESVQLTVQQPYSDNSQRKSAILTAAKKAKLKTNPNRVRFAESVIVNGAPVITPSNHESYIPFMPNVLKVFLENGQTKSFKYDNKTTVKDVLNSLQEKLNISCVENFSLVLQNMKSSSHGKMSLLQEHESLAEVAARPGSQHFKCLYRVAFVPRDAYDLLTADPNAFEYFYMQCCNDVVQGRFASELKYDVALRLAALHIQQHAVSSNVQQGKISVKAIEKECGLDKFVPSSVLSAMKPKDIRKMINHYMKANLNLAPGQKQITALQAKLHYMKIISELRTFGGKCFMATLVEKKTEAMLIVGPKCAISVVTNIKNNTLSRVAEFEELDSLSVTKESENMQRVELHLKDEDIPVGNISMLNEDVHDFIALVEGYYRLYVNPNRSLLREPKHLQNNNTDPTVPGYRSKHQVVVAPWSYATDQKQNEEEQEQDETEVNEAAPEEQPESTKTLDLSCPLPSYKDIQDGKDISCEPQKPKEVPEVKKPCTLRVTSPVVKAPLASPDASNISGSSESSINTVNGVSSPQEDTFTPGSLSSPLEDGENSLADANSLDDTHRTDTDSATSSNVSVSTVLSAKTLPQQEKAQGESPVKKNPNAAMTNDPRFNNRTFSSFSSTTEQRYSTDLSSRLSITSDNDSVFSDSNDLQNNNPSDLDLKTQGNLQGRIGSISETDTESTMSESTESIENKPLLLHNKRKENYHHSNPAQQETDITHGDFVQSESDTDSVSTPTDSPSKARLASLNNVTPPPLFMERPQSFGLHSPEQLPASESDFEAIASSFGLRSPDTAVPQECLHPSYNPRLFCDGGLYLDPDIIEEHVAVTAEATVRQREECTPAIASATAAANAEDNSPEAPSCMQHTSPSTKTHASSHNDLTLIPPPKTPDEEQLIDFTMMMNAPPPGFSDDGSSVGSHQDQEIPTAVADLPSQIRDHLDTYVHSEEDLGTQLAAIDALMLKDAMLANLADKDGVESETDSGNETISSENVEMPGAGWPESLPSHPPEFPVTEPPPRPDLELQDIDAFIASVRVPPPPSAAKSPDDLDLPPPPPSLIADLDRTPTEPVNIIDCFPPPPDVVAQAQESSGTTGGHDWTNPEVVPLPDNVNLEDEYASLIIPPPPSNSETDALQEIPIVPPVNVKTPSPPESGNVVLRDSNKNLTASDKETAEKKRKSLIELEESGPKVAQLAKTLQLQSSTKPKFEEPSKLPVRKTVSVPGKVKRPSVQPPPPPSRLNSYPGTESQSLPSSPPDDANVPQPSGKQSPYVLAGGTMKPSHLLWRPMETKSADNSPVHKPNKQIDDNLRGSTGTLTRNRKGMFAPAPPPRRSSIPVHSPTSTTITHGKSNSVDSTPLHLNDAVEEKYKTLSNINYVNIFEAQSCAKNNPNTEVNVSKATGKTSASNNANHAQVASSPKSVVNVDPSVSINMDKIKAELQRKLSGSDLVSPTLKTKPDPIEYDGSSTNETAEFNIKKVKEELQQKLPKLIRAKENRVESSPEHNQLPHVDQSNYVKPNSHVLSKQSSSEDHYEFDMNKIKNELQQKLAPSSVKKTEKNETPVVAGTVEIEKYKIKPEQKISGQSVYSDGQFDMNKVKAELQQKFTPSASVGSSPHKIQKSEIPHKIQKSETPHKIQKSDIRLVSTGSLDSPTITDSLDNRGSLDNRDSLDKRDNLDNRDSLDSVDGEINQIYSRSPVVSRRQYSFDFLRQLREPTEHDNTSDTSSDGAVFGEYRTPSPKVGRSNTFAGSQGKQGSPSPKGSPLVARHSSFSKLAERVPSPLRSLFGGGDRERIPPDSDGNSAPPSPRRIPSVSNNSSPLTKTAVFSRSNGNTQGNGKSGKKKIPTTVVRPFVAETDSDVSTTSLHKEIMDSVNHDPKYATFSTFKRQSSPVQSPRSRSRSGSESLERGRDKSRISPLATVSHPRSGSVDGASQHQLAMEAASKRRSSTNEYPGLDYDRGPVQSASLAHTATLPRGNKRYSMDSRYSESGNTSPTTPTFTTFGSPKGSPKNISRSKTPSEVAKKRYNGENIFRETNADVEMLIKSIETTLSDINRRDFKVTSDQDLKISKDQLVAESRQFVTDSKLLVSSATQNLDMLIENVNSSIHTLAKIVLNCQGTMKSMTSLPAAQNLGSKVKDVATAYKTTVNAAHVAAGKPLSDPQMKLLMRQATTLASILSTLMKTLKLLENG